MKQKEKTALAVCTSKSGNGQQLRLGGFGNSSEFHFNTSLKAPQGSIASLLLVGRANALTTRQLSQVSGLAPREVTLKICQERRAGAPILSDPAAGFWLASDGEEVRRCVVALQKRAREIHKTALALARSMEEGAEWESTRF